MTDQPITECIKCQKPLGADSRDAGMVVCHDHRRCAACGLAVSATEITWCIERDLLIKHARCMVLSDGPALRDDTLRLVDIVNMCTLLIQTPDLPAQLVSEMTFDQRYTFMRGIQSLSASLSVLLIKDKKQFEADVSTRRSNEIREKQEKRMSGADRAARTAKQLGIPAANGKIARQKLSARDKAISALLPFTRDKAIAALLPFMPREQAEAVVDTRLKGTV
jgi:hypothetical protein